MVVMVAFDVHSLKEISQTQLAGVIKLYGTPDEKRELLECNERRMISPVANILIREKIVAAKGGGKYYDQTSAITYYDQPSAITNYVTNH